MGVCVCACMHCACVLVCKCTCTCMCVCVCPISPNCLGQWDLMPSIPAKVSCGNAGWESLGEETLFSGPILRLMPPHLKTMFSFYSYPGKKTKKNVGLFNQLDSRKLVKYLCDCASQRRLMKRLPERLSGR